jgi:hypothetical protein
MPDWTTKTFLLADWLKRAVPNTVQRHKVKAADVLPRSVLVQRIAINPQLVLDRLAFDVKLDADRTGHVVFNVEPQTLRPVLVQAQIAGQPEINVVLGYEVQRAAMAKPDEVQTYDIDLQRKEILASFTSPIASLDLEGTTILLHKAVIDHDGHLTIIYSGSEALPMALDKSRVIEGQAEGPTLGLMPQSLKEGLNQPVPYKDLQVSLVSVRLSSPIADDVPLIAVAQLLAKTGPELHDVQLPVVIKGTLHWVPFKDVAFMRTGNSLMLLAPTNRPFWLDPPNE